MSPELTAASKELGDHILRFPVSCLAVGTFASEEFDRLYHNWIRVRWDENDPWVRRVWMDRP